MLHLPNLVKCTNIIKVLNFSKIFGNCKNYLMTSKQFFSNYDKKTITRSIYFKRFYLVFSKTFNVYKVTKNILSKDNNFRY